MSKMLNEYFFDMQLFKNSEFGWIENQYLQLNINGCCMLCLKENQPILLERLVTKHYLTNGCCMLCLKENQPILLERLVTKHYLTI